MTYVVEHMFFTEEYRQKMKSQEGISLLSKTLRYLMLRIQTHPPPPFNAGHQRVIQAKYQK